MSDKTTNPQPSTNAATPEVQTPPSSRVALIVLTACFCIISVVGMSFIYSFWKNIDAKMAVGRSAAFAAFMAGVHIVGYRLWKRQFVQEQAERQRLQATPLALAYTPAIKSAMIQQVIFFILAVLMLDMGLTLHITVIAIMAFWFAFGVIIFRRPRSPTKGDIRFIRYGFLLIFVVVFMVGPFVWHALGRM